MTVEIVSADWKVQGHYEQCLRNGCSPLLAEMLATRTFPGTKGTDRAFMQGRNLDGSQFEGLPPIVGKAYVEKARAAGVNPAGKYYSGPLAEYPGDPRAWVDSLDDVRRIARERGLNVQGAVEIESPEVPHEPAPYRVAPDIVARHVEGLIADRPDLDRAAVAAEVGEKLSGVHGR